MAHRLVQQERDPIVEFANQQMRAGASIVEAALRAAQTRCGRLLMTSIAFVSPSLPLFSPAARAARHVTRWERSWFGGMRSPRFLNLAITPVL